MLELAKIIEGLNVIKVIGNIDRSISHPQKLDPLNIDDSIIMWAGSKYYDTLRQVNKGVIICEEIKVEDISSSCTYLIVENPRSEFRILLTEFFASKTIQGVALSAVVSEDSEIADSVIIGENVVIEFGCLIQEGVIINHNTVIKKDTVIGRNSKIGSCCVIGGVGFGYERDKDGRYVFIPHIGNVKIGENVEIGNNTTVDRAVMGSTLIEDNVKIDNLVHIAHGVHIGKNSLIIANAMVAGSVSIGENVWVAPSSSILNKVDIKSNSTIGMGAVVLKQVEEGDIIVGNPGKVLKKK